MNRRLTLLAACALAAVAVCIGRPWAHAEGIPSDENALVYEGTLQRDGVPYDGSAEVLVALFSEATTAGTFTLSEVASGCGDDVAGLAGCACTVTQTVNATSGRFSVPLSADCTAAVREHRNLWVEVRAIVGGAEESFGRTRMTAAPYAIEADTADVARVARDALDGVPVGGILDWWRPPGSGAPVPDGFQVCNGDPITSGPLAPAHTPDLRDRFVLSVGSVDEIGSTGGSHSVSVTTSRDGRHRHQWGRFEDRDGTNQFWYCTSTGCWHQDTWQVINANPSWSRAPHWAMSLNDWGGSDESVDYVTLEDGEHEHTVTLDNRPQYYGLLKIMRTE